MQTRTFKISLFSVEIVTAAASATHATVLATQGFEGATADTMTYAISGAGNAIASDPGNEFPAGSSRVRSGSLS